MHKASAREALEEHLMGQDEDQTIQIKEAGFQTKGSSTSQYQPYARNLSRTLEKNYDSSLIYSGQVE